MSTQKVSAEKNGDDCTRHIKPANALGVPTQMSVPFIRVQGLCARYGMSRGAIYNLIALPEFPKAIYLNTKVPLFRMDEVVAFEESRRQRMGVKGVKGGAA